LIGTPNSYIGGAGGYVPGTSPGLANHRDDTLPSGGVSN